jgi:transglutaminase-like putative cysteine protease
VIGALFRLVRDRIAYEMAPDLDRRDDWRATATIERGIGFCQQKAVVLASVLRARGVPAALAFDDLWDAKIRPPLSDLLGGQVIEFHGFVLAFVGGRWLRLDPSLDAALCERKGYRLTEFEPGVGACLPTTDLAGEDHFRLVRELGAYADLTDEMVARMLTFPALQDPAWKQHVRRRGASM